MDHVFGDTTNFQLSSTDSFWTALTPTEQNDVTASANYLLGQVEGAFTTTTDWFGTDTSKFGPGNRQERRPTCTPSRRRRRSDPRHAASCVKWNCRDAPPSRAM